MEDWNNHDKTWTLFRIKSLDQTNLSSTATLFLDKTALSYIRVIISYIQYLFAPTLIHTQLLSSPQPITEG